MGRQKAQATAREEQITWGELKALIDGASVDGRMSAVNPAIPLSRIRDIHLAVIAKRQLTDAPKAWRQDVYNRNPNAVKPSKDFLIITNILRDFG